MMLVARSDNSVIGRWWWTVDRWTLAALLALILIGIVLIAAASPPVAERIGAEQFHFVRRHLLFLPLGLFVMLAVSLLEPRTIRRLAVAVFLAGLVLLVATLATGSEIKGARRWLSLFGFSLQVSEFVKPSFVVVAAWLFDEHRRDPRMCGNWICTALFLLTAGLLVAQPDLGMTGMVTLVWLVQFFIAGMPVWWLAVAVLCGAAGMVGAYATFDHVRLRVDRFFGADAEESYQVGRSLEAFMNGGLIGRGPGEGRVKNVLPDAHADFVFAVAGEEMGLVVCLIIVFLFAFVVLRGFSHLLGERNQFIMLSVAGLLTIFGLQALVNMASTLGMIPTKGMTLPFISYGGSSLLALAYGMGMVLALSRRRADAGDLR